VMNAHEALLHINRLIAERIRPPASSDDAVTRILDLGCGVGGTAIWLAHRSPVEITGVTISKSQVAEARFRAGKAGLAGRCKFVHGDFHDLDLSDRWDTAYAIEAFSHAISSETFLDAVSRHLKPAGRLILVDDFLTDEPPDHEAAQRQRIAWIRRFQKGWRLPNLIPVPRLHAAAERAGFRSIRTTDLTPLIRLPAAIPLAFLRLISTIPFTGPYWASLAGGVALQVCLQNHWVSYQMIELQRDGSGAYGRDNLEA
jgi:ubiquinone/menaquinone biosynthesis C-methylase UbiE